MNVGQVDGYLNTSRLFDGEIKVLSMVDSAKVGGKMLVGDRISSGDQQSVIGAVAHQGSRNFEVLEIKSELDNLKINSDYLRATAWKEERSRRNDLRGF